MKLLLAGEIDVDRRQASHGAARGWLRNCPELKGSRRRAGHNDGSCR
jgi:hypothetical protein